MRQVCNHWKLCGEARFADILSEIDELGSVELTAENREKLQQLLQLSIDSQDDCPVCMDSLRDPVITCCAHTYCFNCIERVIETQHKCPMCRAELPTAGHLVRPAKEAAQAEFDTDTSSSKVTAMMKILKASLKNDKTTKTVIFSQWTSFLDILESNLEELGIHFTRIDGSMPPFARDAAMNELESSPECSVLLASLGVCSVGLNLVAANQVIMSDSWWAPAIEDQAVDRVYRLGQKREVKVWRVVIEGSIEERVLQIQEDKRKLVSVAMGEKKGNRKNTGRIGDIIRLLG
jgi:SWI/SNF-related matrix-associated actin-dependent regulator of chromatin subfamily A3